MVSRKKLARLLKNPRRVLFYMWIEISRFIKSDKLYLRVLYWCAHGKTLHFSKPVTFTEKIQCLKLINTSQLCTNLVDKYAVREFVAEKIGEQYLVPLLGVWEHFDDIDFERLPNQFVLKTTHGSGGVAICTDKSSFDFEKAKKKLEKSLKYNYFWKGREYPYKNVPPRIVAEQFMSEGDEKDLVDYKFFCFDGVPKLLFFASERYSVKGEHAKFDFYDMEMNHLPISVVGHGNSEKRLSYFPKFDEMKMLASKLSAGFPHVRVDFYLVKGHIYFGEMTFHHDGGLAAFSPREWDNKLGEWIKLPQKNDK